MLFIICTCSLPPAKKKKSALLLSLYLLVCDLVFGHHCIQDLIDYYNISTPRDWTGRVKSFNANGSIGNGLMPILHKSAPQVALFSARGPNIKDFNFQDADLLKPDILAPGSLIWAAWSPNGTDEANYVGKELVDPFNPSLDFDVSNFPLVL